VQQKDVAEVVEPRGADRAPTDGGCRDNREGNDDPQTCACALR